MVIDEVVQKKQAVTGDPEELDQITKALVDRILNESERKFKEFIISCR